MCASVGEASFHRAGRRGRAPQGPALRCSREELQSCGEYRGAVPRPAGLSIGGLPRNIGPDTAGGEPSRLPTRRESVRSEGACSLLIFTFYFLSEKKPEAFFASGFFDHAMGCGVEEDFPFGGGKIASNSSLLRVSTSSSFSATRTSFSSYSRRISFAFS